jgi:hypothetical protein
MLELGSSGSVRGVSSNGHPYRHPGSNLPLRGRGSTLSYLSRLVLRTGGVHQIADVGGTRQLRQVLPRRRMQPAKSVLAKLWGAPELP